MKIGLSMGQSVTRLTGGIEKTDVNIDYQTNDDDDSYAIDGNGEQEPSKEVEETSDRPKVWIILQKHVIV